MRHSSSKDAVRSERARPLILALFVLIGLLDFAVTAKAANVYRFGVVPQFEPRKLFSIWKPILRELERRTGLVFRMVGSPKIPEFEKSFLAGEFDFAYMNPYHSMLATRQQGYRPLVRDGGRALFGVLVVRKDSRIENVKQLQGRKIVFPAPNALGASLLMRADLATIQGIDFVPVYVQTHSSVYLHVGMGLADAGGGVMSTLASQKPELRDSLRVIYRTRKMAPHPVTAHPRVPQADRERVVRAFLDMALTKTGAALLAKVPIRKLVPATAEDYSVLSKWGLERFYVEND